MTKKDYVKIAAALNDVKPGSGTSYLTSWKLYDPKKYDQWEADIKAIVDVLAADNPRFDRTRFRKACGIED